MSTVDYLGRDNLAAMSAMSRYNGWIYDTLAPSLGPEVFEAGCGNGNIARWIVGGGRVRRYVGVDLSEAFCRSLQHDLKPPAGVTCEFYPRDLQSFEASEFSSRPFDTIVCSNVLEHIENDIHLLEKFYLMLKPGGALVLQVPAFQWLFGSIDAIDQHYRRYSRTDLVPKVRQVGFEVRQVFYFNALGILAWIWHGKILKLTTHSQTELKLWDTLVPVLRRAESCLRPPLGLSLFVMAQKPS